jgi:hypothetical protein
MAETTLLERCVNNDTGKNVSLSLPHERYVPLCSETKQWLLVLRLVLINTICLNKVQSYKYDNYFVV